MSHQENAPISITPGAIRFNTDSMKLEYFRIGMEAEGTASYAGIGTLAAGEWVQLTTDSPDIQTGGTRGICAGGFVPSPDATTRINFFNISTTSNAETFGDLTQKRYALAGVSSRVRGLFAGGRTDPSPTARFSTIDEITIASTGGATAYGDLDTQQVGPTGFSNGTRGVFAGGYNPTHTNKIQYVTIAVKEDAIDFGDLSGAKFGCGGVSNKTRGIIAGGQNPSGQINTIEFITISTLGNAADFGDLTQARRLNGNDAASNAVRGVFAGGVTPSNVNTIDYITIATLGDAVDFGDLLEVNNSKSGCASPTRAVFSGGQVPATTNSMEYVQIMTTGNSIDFGDLTLSQESASSLSNGHGGL